MSEPKRQEASNRQGDRHNLDQPAQNNPFSSYMSNINHSPNQRQTTRRRERQKSLSSQRSSRSRSREQRQKDKRLQNLPSKQEPYDQRKGGQQKKEYRDAISYPPKKEQQKDQSYFKTKICPLYQKGECKKGSSCSFAHSQKEIRGLPNFRKTRLCIPFKNGQCPKPSADCKYAHGEGEIRKLAYDYFPSKHHEHNRYEKYERNDRGQRNDRNQRSDRRYERDDRKERDSRGRGERYERNDRDRGYRDRPKDREGSKDRSKDHYYSKDYSRKHSSSITGSNLQSYAPNLGPGQYPQHYNNAYMIPPSLPVAPVYGQSGDLYLPPSTSHSSIGNSANYAPSSSSVPPSGQGHSSYPPPLYMGPSYEYGFGYHPHTYPPYNSSSV